MTWQYPDAEAKKINLEKSKTVFHGVLRTVNRDEQDLECGGEARGLRLKEKQR